MNWDEVKGNWTQFRGHVREQWGKLTDDDLDIIAGRRDQLLGALHKRYGQSKQQVEQEVGDFERRIRNTVKPAR